MTLAIWISGGLLLAVAVSWTAVNLLPEDRIKLGLAVYEPIDYGILPHDARLADIERGRSYYIQLCALCHGAQGRGQGEYSYRMIPKPTDLTGVATADKSDAQLDTVIKNGVRGSAMRGWGDTLGGIQRQQIIDFIRYLELRHSQG